MYDKPDYLLNGPRKYEENFVDVAVQVEPEFVQEQAQAKERDLSASLEESDEASSSEERELNEYLQQLYSL